MAGSVLNLDDKNFETSVNQGVTLVDFYADWCGPCKVIAPVINELADELKNQAKIAKINVDHASETATKFQVTSIPTLILFKDGKELHRIVGLRDKQTLKSMVQAAI